MRWQDMTKEERTEYYREIGKLGGKAPHKRRGFNKPGVAAKAGKRSKRGRKRENNAS